MRLRILAALLAALLVLVVAVEAFNMLSAYRDLRAGAAEARAAATELGSDPGGWTQGHVDRAAAESADARALIDRGRARLHADPGLSTAALLPLAGDQVVAVRDLADAADAGAAAVQDAVRVAEVYRAASDGQGSPQRFLDAMKKAEPLLADATGRLSAALDTVNRDRGRPLAPPLRTELDRTAVTLADAITQADSILQASQLAPAALGDPAPKRYLVLLANPTELRPDGGFSGVVGTIAFDHGSPSAIDLVDQYTLNGRYKQKFPIPLPIQQHLIEANHSLELGDAGWDPDLPSAAPLYEQMWQSATGQGVDGTLIVDPYAIASLLRITGPVNVAGYGTFTADDFFSKLNILINAEGSDKATAVPAVAAATLKAILGQPGANYSRMASTLLEQARQRHVQIAVHDGRLAAVLHAANLDGAVRLAGDGDYLMVVDANLGGNKADAYMTKTAELRVEKPASGLANHELKVAYTFAPLVTDVDRKLVPSEHNNPGRHYRNYVRIYVPQEANLTGFRLLVDGQTAFTSALTENTVAHGKRILGAYIDMGPGQRADLSITYIAPLEPGSGYHLLVQKQAGRPGFATSLWLSYPGGEARRSTDLVTDADLRVSW